MTPLSRISKPSTRIDATRRREIRTSWTPLRLARWMAMTPWHTADAASATFESRLSFMPDIITRVRDVYHIELDGSERIEFVCSNFRVTLYPDDITHEYAQWLRDCTK